MRLPRLGRACLHTSADDTRLRLRELLRETAQSVAVVTAVLPAAPTPIFHGATLSSFSSIALDPHPLIAFSLRVPSRTATALNAHLASSAPAPSAHLVINLLSAAQPHLADRFARPDVHPRPFEDPRVRWTRSPDGLPLLSGALGALACRLAGPSMALAPLGGSDGALVGRGEGDAPLSAGTGLASELFIARVIRVERVPLPEDAQLDSRLYRLPLVYHRRRYTTVEGDAKS